MPESIDETIAEVNTDSTPGWRVFLPLVGVLAFALLPAFVRPTCVVMTVWLVARYWSRRAIGLACVVGMTGLCGWFSAQSCGAFAGEGRVAMGCSGCAACPGGDLVAGGSGRRAEAESWVAYAVVFNAAGDLCADHLPVLSDLAQ